MARFIRRNLVKIVLGAVVILGLGILARSPGPAVTENLQHDAAVQLLAPNGPTVVEFSLDPDDTAMSDVQVGSSAAAVSFDRDLRDLPQVGPEEKTLNVEFEMSLVDRFDPDFVDPVLQSGAGINAIPGADQNFAGLDLNNWGAGWPPDTQGDVGPNHYIQAVNTSIGVYSKTGTQLAAFTFDTFFSGTGTPCDADNNGDPVVLYDDVSGRWILSDFAWTNFVSGPYYECIAVSKTADPVSGGWWFYGLRADDASHPWLNDYPKMGVWGDGIYMTANMFDILNSAGSASYKGVRLWALNRDELINGSPLNYQYGDLGSAYFSLLPSNATGTMPSAGTPNYLTSLQTFSSLYTWKLSIDWNNAANSTLTGPFSTSIASFSNAGSVPQASSGVNLDSLAGRLMAQLQYKNVGGTESLWVTHSVSTSGRAAVRWYELRNLSGTPSVYQQGTYSPDSVHRWMGSVGVDQDGNMAVVYSGSSSSVNPSVRYAGRLATDSLGTLGQGEGTLIQGNGAQTTYNRWGDYSAMGVDPVDGCTFWFTTEYLASTGTNWQTRVGSFKFPSCGGGSPTPTPTSPPPPTPTPTDPPPPTPTPTDPPGPTATPTSPPPPTPTPTATPPPTGGGTVYVSSTSGGNAGGVSFNDEDILAYDIGTGSFSMVFDSSDVGITQDLNAFYVMADGTLLLSYQAAVSVSGLGTVDDSDIVRFIPTSLGTSTAGTFEWYFDGSDVGLSSNSEDIDAIGFAPDGRLLISTTGSPSVPGVSGDADEDLLAFDAFSLGSSTSGTWSMYFDGSDVGLSSSSSEDVNGTWVDAGNNDVYLTTVGSFAVSGVSGTGGDIFVCTPGSLGTSTSCTFTMFWDGSANGYGSEILDGFSVVP